MTRTRTLTYSPTKDRTCTSTASSRPSPRPCRPTRTSTCRVPWFAASAARSASSTEPRTRNPLSNGPRSWHNDGCSEKEPPMPTVAQCPNAACALRCTVPDGAQGKTLRCPRCGQTFVPPAVVPVPASVAVPAAAPVPSGADMTVVGRYEVRARLGAGAFGAVYRAYDPQLEREVALKMLRQETLASPQAVERFRREAKAAARMLHPNIVPVHDAGQHGNDFYIASAFIAGGTLSAQVPEKGMEPTRAVGLVVQLLDALAYAHSQGVLHRDVKPDNCLVDDQGRLYLTDFGLAGWREQQRSRMTKLGAVLGTAAYMAPEQAKGD